MSGNNNDIVSLSIKPNDIVNNDIVKAKEVESIAMTLVDKFKSPDSYKFYCLIGYKLSESKIWHNYEAALKGKNPPALFNWLCRRDMHRG